MATNAEAAALGFILPGNNDLISGGDDAISANARAAVDHANSMRWVFPSIANGVDLNTIKTIGTRYVVSWGNNPNRPPGALSGTLNTSPAAGAYVLHTWIDDAGWIARRLERSDGTWNPWNRSKQGSPGAAVGNVARVSLWQNTVPPVYTGGKGALAFTFDHGLTKFKSAGLPAAMSSRGFGYALALNSATLTGPENNGATTADILGWAGAEIWNHGRTHSAAANDDEVFTEIVTGKTELETKFGREVFGYIPAGVGPTGLNGFDGGSSPAAWADTYAGQLIMQHHAVTSGYMGSGGVRLLDGTIRQGLSRFTIDALTVTRIKTQIDLAVTNRVGVMFMLHPNLLDTAGYLTTAQFIEVLDYARTRQQAGALAVLSPGELVRAHAGPAPAEVAATTARLGALEYDTGFRACPLPAGITGGSVNVCRTGPIMTIQVYSVRGMTSTIDLGTLPVGMRPKLTMRLPLSGGGVLQVSYTGAISITGQTSVTAWMDGTLSYRPESLSTLPSPPFSPA